MSTPTPTALLERIAALLAKADSTEFPEEAEALVAKAQQLMTRHAIDHALVAAAGRTPQERVGAEDLLVPGPYATAKTTLLGSVAFANGCRVVRISAGSGDQRCTLIGHESDRGNVRTLFAALSVHAARALHEAVVPAADTPRRFRQAFLLAFAGRIGERLVAASASARTDATAEATPGAAAGVELVLADRAESVDRAFRAAFPRVRSARVTASSGAGFRHGRAAADRAGLGQDALGGTRRSLPPG